MELLSDSKVEKMINKSGVKNASTSFGYALTEGSGKMDYGAKTQMLSLDH